MVDWYYHAPGQGRVGPLTDDALRARYRDRTIARDTLVWHDGMREWQPLDRVSEQLGLDAIVPDASAPPPLPPSNATSTTPAFDARLLQPAPKKGLSGCAIAAIVLLACVVPVIAILAAIAIPAYQGYVVRAKVQTAMIEVVPLRDSVGGEIAHGTCPQRVLPGNARAAIAQVRVGAADNGTCTIEIGLTGSGPLAGAHVWLDAAKAAEGSGPVEWNCHSDLPDRYLPVPCRAPHP